MLLRVDKNLYCDKIHWGDKMNLPSDNMMLLSVVNTKLRDFYKDLDVLCEDMNVDKDEITDRLKGIGYEYDKKLNRFI